MVFDIGELEKKSIGGKFYRDFFLEKMLEEYEEAMTSARGILGENSYGLLPESREITRVPIFEMRRRLWKRPERKKLIPSARDIIDLSMPKTYIYMEPRPEEDQVGIAGFDLRVGNFIAWSDELFRWGGRYFVSELELSKSLKDYKFLGLEKNLF